MITVVIPTLNEEQTIDKVVNFAKNHPGVNEVIVVDDQSLDNTKQKAVEAGAKVFTSARLGKGFSMKEGVMAASNDIIAFLDGDIDPYPEDTLALMTQPLLNDDCDFVKSTFSRNAGRVTELVAKPLLSIFYPELSTYSQPLSGMIAGKKSYLKKVDFFNDYGVDIGILIDIYLMQARIKEVNIGYIENKSKPWHTLGKMSREVAKAIIEKAGNRKEHLVNLDELQTINIISDELEGVMKDNIKPLRKLAAFDMDGTLLRGRFIDNCAREFGFTEQLKEIRSRDIDAATRTKQIAMLLKDRSIGDLLRVVRDIPIVEDAAEVIEELKNRGYVVGIITDSYQLIANYVKNCINADFALANRLEHVEGKATGEVNIPFYYFYSRMGVQKPTLGKSNAMHYICNEYKVDLPNTIAVGDSENDLDMLEVAGIGVSFCSSNEKLNKIADINITKPSMLPILDFA